MAELSTNQAQLLVALQDLEEMIRDAEDPESRKKLEAMGFPLENVDKLRDAQDELEERIKPQMLSRYRRIADRSGKAIVPVVGNVCTGCFTNVPSIFTSKVNADKVISCETCGRMLYWP